MHHHRGIRRLGRLTIEDVDTIDRRPSLRESRRWPLGTSRRTPLTSGWNHRASIRDRGDVSQCPDRAGPRLLPALHIELGDGLDVVGASAERLVDLIRCKRSHLSRSNRFTDELRLDDTPGSLEKGQDDEGEESNRNRANYV